MGAQLTLFVEACTTHPRAEICGAGFIYCPDCREHIRTGDAVEAMREQLAAMQTKKVKQ